MSKRIKRPDPIDTSLIGYEKSDGIYAIICPKTKRVYIGKTKNVRIRLANHNMNLKRKKHSCYALQEDYNKGYRFYAKILETDIGDGIIASGREAYYMGCCMINGLKLYNDEKERCVLNRYFRYHIRPKTSRKEYLFDSPWDKK